MSRYRAERRPAATVAPPSPDVVVQVRDLRMSYGHQVVLAGVDLSLNRGEVVALLGPNGAGKTTTVEILEGFRARSAGEVEVLGQDPLCAGEAWRARIGIVLQSWRDHSRWTVRELVGHVARHYTAYSEPGRPRPHDVMDVLARVGLDGEADSLVQSLSGGQRRRVDVAVGVIGNPELLFLDEPTAGFDPAARRRFHELVRELTVDRTTTVLLTTHDLNEAEALADRIVILADGRVRADGTREELARQVASGTLVEWIQDGRSRSQQVQDSTTFVRQLLADGAHQISGLSVRSTSLEEVYLSLVAERTAGDSDVEGSK